MMLSNKLTPLMYISVGNSPQQQAGTSCNVKSPNSAYPVKTVLITLCTNFGKIKILPRLLEAKDSHHTKWRKSSNHRCILPDYTLALKNVAGILPSCHRRPITTRGLKLLCAGLRAAQNKRKANQ